MSTPEPYLAFCIRGPIYRQDPRGDIDAALAALTILDIHYLKAYGAPPLYQSGVRYIREGPQRREAWLTVPDIIAAGGGDCEDLAAWRAAELRVRGYAASARAIRVRSGWHIIVECEGRVEDPSARLGMLDQ